MLTGFNLFCSRTILCGIVLCPFLCGPVAMEMSSLLGGASGGAAATPEGRSSRTSRAASGSLQSTPASQKSRSASRASSRPPASGGSARRALDAAVASAASSEASVAAGASNAGEGSRGQPSVREFPARVSGNDWVGSQLTIFQLQWYILAHAGMQVNLGKLTHASVNYAKIMKLYTDQVPGVAEGYWAYMTSPLGGRKGSKWVANKDVAWLKERLMHKSSTLDARNRITGNYLWNQWVDTKGLRAQIQDEALIAWNIITRNGTEVEQSGKTFEEVWKQVVQQWYEQTINRSMPKGRDYASIKAESADLWQAAAYSPHSDDKIPRAECCIPREGHGADCRLGHMPPDYPMPKSYLVMMCMSPAADYLAAYHETHRDSNDLEHFPPLCHDKKFDDMFGSITMSSQAPAPGASGGAAPTGDRERLGRRAMREGQPLGDAIVVDDDVQSMWSSVSKDFATTCKDIAAPAADDGAASVQAQAGMLQARNDLLRIALGAQNDDNRGQAQAFLATMLADATEQMQAAKRRRVGGDDGEGASTRNP